MIVDEPVARDDYWLPLWLLEGKSGKKWCISLCFIAWQLQLASLMGCDFMRFRFKPDSSNDDEEEDEYYLSVGFFRRATSDSMTEFDGSSCMIYKDLERSVYQNEGTTNCAIVSWGFSSVALLYFILAMFGVVRHKNRESYGLAVVTIIAGLMMAWPQNFGASERCDVDHYTNSVIGANPNFPQFKYFTECNYGVQGVCGLIACLMWISAGLLLLCNAHYTKTPMQLARAEELKKREHLRLEYFDQDTYQNHKALAKEQEELNQKTLKAIRITTMSANREYEAMQKYQETKSKEKQESAQPDRGQDMVSNIEEPEGTDVKMVSVLITAQGHSFRDKEEDVRVPVPDDEETGLVKSDFIQSTNEKSDGEEKAGVVKSVSFLSTIEKYDDEEKAGVVKSDVFQSTRENFDDGDSESDSSSNNSIGDHKKDGSNLSQQRALEGSITPDQNFFDADDISFAGSQDQSVLTGVSYGDTINVTPAKQLPKNVKTFADQSSTITMDKEIE